MSEQKIRKKYKKSRYSLETLINFSIEKKFKLLKEYTNNNIHIECIIEGTCATEGCENNFSKNYKRLLTISGPYCKFCQTGKNIYDLNYLNNYSKKYNIELLKDYSDINICRDTEIEGKCNNETCDNNFKKNFRYLIEEGGPYCNDCTEINKFKKMEETNLINFGVKYHTMSENGKNKVKNSIIEKYGVDSIFKIPVVKEKIKESVITKYGVDNIFKSKEIKEKIKQTNLTKYGVENPLQNDDIKEKTKLTNLKIYGTISPLQNKEVNKKTIKTNIEKFGTEFPIKNMDIKQKVINTNLQKFGFESHLKNDIIRQRIKETLFKNFSVYNCTESDEIKEKIKKTVMEKYGVEYILQNKEIKEKIKKTIRERYGVEHISHNLEIMEKMSKNAYKKKIYTTKTGKEYSCQGYEHYALKILIEDMKLNEDNIIMGVKNVPKINYKDDEGIDHVHYPDIYINNQNKIIEIKSTWTLKKKSDSVFLKQKSAKEQGYIYEIWVISPKGYIIEKYI